MEGFCGAMNSVGYTTSINSGYLPPHDHITYPGVFNQLRYNVGPKTDKVLDLHHGYARFQFAESKFDSEIHNYLALFTKGRANGQPRDPTRRLNSVICLDISGSMTASLDGSYPVTKTRISLCIQAIKMFISKLQPQDSVGMTTFDTQAHLIFEPTLKKDIDQGIYQKLDKIKAYGGNTLIDGFKMSRDLLLKQMKNQAQNFNYQNRVVLLSDVCDDSITHSLEVIKDAANEQNIHLTIVGISTEFQSNTCEDLRQTKGFNYFCATSDEDVLKYLFETFDYTFFPSSSNVLIELESDDIQKIEVFGTPDQIKSQPYQEDTTTNGNSFVVSRIQTCFPSEIQIDKNEVYTVGGLILIKIKRKSKGSVFKGRIHLSYKDYVGASYKQIYDLSYQFHPEEQFLSHQMLRQALCGFSYVSELKTILKQSSLMSGKEIYEKFYPMLVNLKQICPQRKQEELSKTIDIVKGMKPLDQVEVNKDEEKETVKQKVK